MRRPVPGKRGLACALGARADGSIPQAGGRYAISYAMNHRVLVRNPLFGHQGRSQSDAETGRRDMAGHATSAGTHNSPIRRRGVAVAGYGDFSLGEVRPVIPCSADSPRLTPDAGSSHTYGFSKPLT